MRGALRRALVPLAVAATLATGLTATLHAQKALASTTTFCGLTGFPATHSYVWTGAAHDNTWQTPGNWNVGGVPATAAPGNPYDPNGPGNFDDASRDVDYVCIGAPGGTAANVTLGGVGGDNIVGAAIAALDVGQNAHLTVTGNSRLWLNNPQTTTTPSSIRSGSELDLNGATLGGVGNLIVSGKLDAASNSSFPVTITTRWCDVGATCTAAPTNRGIITVASGGQFIVNGTPKGGINLEDEKIVDNSGTVTLANSGYIAADNGTSIKNEAGGTISIADDFGIYQGRGHFGASLAILTNLGALKKSAGTGNSVVGLNFQQSGAGSVAVTTGSLTVGRSTTGAGVSIPAATVTAGGSYGLGACPALVSHTSTPCSSLTVSASSPQAALVTLSTVGGNSSVQVATQTTGLPSGHIGQAVQFETPGSTPTVTKPNLFTLLYDASVWQNRTLSSVKLERAADGSNTFLQIANCPSNGNPPAGQSCVDMRGISGVSSTLTTGGGAKIVIRTTQNSRWTAI